MNQQKNKDILKSKKWIYAIGQKNGPLKIGITDNVENRLSILNVGSPNFLSILFKYKADSIENAIKIEKELHYNFRLKHIRGEWFNINESDISEIQKLISSLKFYTFVPDNWSLDKKRSNLFTAEVCKITRNALQLTQSELARLSNLNEQTIINFENNITRQQRETIEKIINAFVEKGVEFIEQDENSRYKIML